MQGRGRRTCLHPGNATWGTPHPNAVTGLDQSIPSGPVGCDVGADSADSLTRRVSTDYWR